MNLTWKLAIQHKNYGCSSVAEKKIATLTRDELKSWAQIDEMEGFEESEDALEDQDDRRPK